MHLPRRMRYRRQIAALVAAGLPGVITIVITLLPVVRAQAEHAGRNVSPVTLALLVAIQPLVLLTLASASGVFLAPRVGLRSHLAASAEQGRMAWSGFSRE